MNYYDNSNNGLLKYFLDSFIFRILKPINSLCPDIELIQQDKLALDICNTQPFFSIYVAILLLFFYTSIKKPSRYTHDEKNTY